MNNKVQEEIQPRGLQSSISFPAEWNSFFSSLQSIKHPMFPVSNQQQFFAITKFQPLDLMEERSIYSHFGERMIQLEI
jgi:hypothetical protein